MTAVTICSGFGAQENSLSLFPLIVKVKVKSLSCPTLCNPMVCSLPGSSLHGILQARVNLQVALGHFSNGLSLIAVSEATLHCSAWASHFCVLSYPRAQAQGTQASIIAVHGLSSFCTQVLGHTDFSNCGTQAHQLWLVCPGVCRLQQLWHVGSVIVTHRLNCSMAFGIFPDQRLNPCPLLWPVNSYSLYHQFVCVCV